MDIEKKFDLGLGFSGVTSQSGHVYATFWPTLSGPRCQPNEPFFGSSVLLQARLRSASLERLNDFLEHLELKASCDEMCCFLLALLFLKSSVAI